MCNWQAKKTLFENKKDNAEIVLREYGCGATGSIEHYNATFKAQYFTSHFIRFTAIDTNKIDRSEWRRVVTKVK